MNGNEVTEKDMVQWEKEGWFPVCCRLCGKIILYPKTYNKNDFIGYECTTCHNLNEISDKVIERRLNNEY